METRLDLDDLCAAARRIAPHAHRTPVMRCRILDAMAGCELFLKCENLQRAGAFKYRGALNTVLSLGEEEARRGVVTHSSGNHGQALARAASVLDVPATVVVPEGAPAVKRRAIEGYGARVLACGASEEERAARVAEVVQESGATVVHAYEDPRVIAGQGTATLELHEEVPDLDLLLVPLGGGGLCSGACLATRGVAPGCRVLGVEPDMADDARRSLQGGRIVPSGYPPTIADGLRTSLGPRTFSILRQHLAGVVTVSEREIVRAMRLLFERAKLVVEPSGAVGVAAALAPGSARAGRRIGVILSGGNVDLDRLPW